MMLLHTVSIRRSGRNLCRVVAAQPGAIVAIACVGGLVVLLVCAWLIQLIWGATVEPVAIVEEPEIRVRIMRGVDEVVIAEPPLVEVSVGAGEVALVATPIRVSLSDGLMIATDGEGTAHTWGQETARIGPIDDLLSAGAVPLRVGAFRYPGQVRLVLRDGGIDVVNDTRIDSYLPGVIAKELFSHWHEEAYRAQAICARSFALHVLEVSSRPSRHFDINSGTNAQAYVGVTENVKAIDAVRSTRGQVLVYEGELIRTYYSSTCGGRSGSAADVWGSEGKDAFNAALPLGAHERMVACEEAPLYRWSRTRSVDELSDRLKAFGVDRWKSLRRLDRLSAIEIVERAVTGRPAVYGVRDEDGEVHEITAEEMRLACNFATDRYDWPSDGDRVMSNDLSFSVDGDVVEIEGRGFGHGVGMCQYGAEGMATGGFDAEAMLAEFFAGAAIERVFD